MTSPKPQSARDVRREQATGVMDRLHRAGWHLGIDKATGGLAYDAGRDDPADADLDELRRHKRPVLAELSVVALFDLAHLPGTPGPWNGWMRHGRAATPPAGGPNKSARKGKKGRLLRAARRAGFPAVPVPGRPGERVAGGRAAWRAFCARAPAGLVRAVADRRDVDDGGAADAE